MQPVAEMEGGLSTARQRDSAGRSRLLVGAAALSLLIVLGAAVALVAYLHQRQARLDRELVAALEEYDPKQVSRLVRQGASIHLTNWEGTSVTGVAACWPEPELLRELLDRGAPVEAIGPKGKYPLVWAASEGRLQQAQILLERGARIDATDDGRTALSYALEKGGREELVRLLLAAGANVNAPDRRGCTPLIWAVARDQPSYVEILCRAGADPSVRERGGHSALDMLLASERHYRHAPQGANHLARIRRMIAALSGGKKVSHYDARRRKTRNGIEGDEHPCKKQPNPDRVALRASPGWVLP